MESQTAIEILCRVDGTVIEVLRDELGLAPCFPPGGSLTAAVEPGCLPDAVRFLRAIREDRSALDCRLRIALPTEVIPLFFLGYQNDGGITIAGARELLSREQLVQDLTRSMDRSAQGFQESHPNPEDRGDLHRDALLALTAHDLRNHLNGILAASQYLLEDAATLLEAEHVTLLQSIESSGRSMFDEIDEVLEASAIESGNVKPDLKPINVLALIKKNISSNQARAERKKVRLELMAAEALPPIMADPIRVNRVVEILLTRSIDACSAGGRIEIAVGVRDQNVVLSVRSEKTAFSVEGMQSVFHPDQKLIQGVSGKAGTVLAFRLAQRIVEAHGGTIGVEGDARTGLIFTVTLPIAVEPAESLPRTQQSW